MKINKYKNYYKNHEYSVNKIDYEWYIRVLEKNIGRYLSSFDKNIKILEIWSWQWKFTYYCKSKWFKNYI